MIGWSFESCPFHRWLKLLNFHFSASNSVAVSGLGIGFQVILKKWPKKGITYPTFNMKKRAEEHVIKLWVHPSSLFTARESPSIGLHPIPARPDTGARTHNTDEDSNTLDSFCTKHCAQLQHTLAKRITVHIQTYKPFLAIVQLCHCSTHTCLCQIK